jgi:hypothetical protein
MTSDCIIPTDHVTYDCSPIFASEQLSSTASTATTASALSMGNAPMEAGPCNLEDEFGFKEYLHIDKHPQDIGAACVMARRQQCQKLHSFFRAKRSSHIHINLPLLNI